MSLREELERVIRNLDADVYAYKSREFILNHGQALLEAVADAERYRWLRDEAHKTGITTSIGIYTDWGSEIGSIGGRDAQEELDEAMEIDARSKTVDGGSV